MKNNYVVIMAGGRGTRFWPCSRKNNPKQFQDIFDDGRTLLQRTYDRFKGVCPAENVFVVTNESYFTQVHEQLPAVQTDHILLEPQMRNTGPCILYASKRIYAENPDAVIVTAPADHFILKEKEFREATQLALLEAGKSERLLTLGITPTRPDTGYGYIQIADPESNEAVRAVKTFTEKPDVKLAVSFLESGDFVWNAGIFIWSATAVLKAFKEFQINLFNAFSDLDGHLGMESEAEAVEKVYSHCHGISVDYAIMEKSENVGVVTCDIGWADLGTWNSLYDFTDKNNKFNVVGKNVLTYDTQSTLIRSAKDKLVVVSGLDDYIVVDHDNVLLICPKKEEYKIKQMLADAESLGGENFI